MIFLENMERDMRMEDAAGEVEKRIDEAVAAARREWEQEAARRIAAARQEGERAAGMSAEEKLAERERQLNEREQQIMRRELYAQMELRFAEEGLPRELAAALNYDGEEAAQRSYGAVRKVFLDAVQARVSERLGGIEVPKSGAAVDPMKLSDEQYYAMRMGATEI